MTAGDFECESVPPQQSEEAQLQLKCHRKLCSLVSWTAEWEVAFRAESLQWQQRNEGRRGGGGGGGTYILYVRYIILLQTGGRQSRKRRKSHRKKDEGLRDRQAAKDANTLRLVSQTQRRGLDRPIFLYTNICESNQTCSDSEKTGWEEEDRLVSSRGQAFKDSWHESNYSQEFWEIKEVIVVRTESMHEKSWKSWVSSSCYPFMWII